jgi:hypothetical protein
MPLPLIGVFVRVCAQGFRGSEERAKNCDIRRSKAKKKEKQVYTSKNELYMGVCNSTILRATPQLSCGMCFPCSDHAGHNLFSRQTCTPTRGQKVASCLGLWVLLGFERAD